MPTATKEDLRTLREKAGLSLEQLAERSGVTMRNLLLYESDLNHLRNTNYSTLVKISSALGVQVDHIFLG